MIDRRSFLKGASGVAAAMLSREQREPYAIEA